MNLTPLRKRVRDTAKDYSLAAVVVDAVGSRCSVRLAQNGQLMTGLPYTGVKPTPGQKVRVDFISGSPVVLTGAALPAVEPAATPIPANPVLSEKVEPDYSGILRYHGGSLMAAYPANEGGMQEALDDCDEGDLIVLPVIELTMDVVMPDWITIKGDSRETSIIHGKVTLAARSRLRALTVRNVGDDPADIAALEQAVDSSAGVDDCNIHACNCGSGEGIGLLTNVGSRASVKNSYLTGETGRGESYAVSGTGGVVALDNVELFGQIDHEETYVHGTYEGEALDLCSQSGMARNLLHPYYESQYTMYEENSMRRSLAGVENLSSIAIAQSNYSSTKAIYAVASKDYVYCIYPRTNNSPTTDGYSIKRYRISDGETVVIDFTENKTARPLITLWEENKIIAYASASARNWDREVYMIDFEQETVTKLFDFPMVVEHGEYEDNYYDPKALVTVVDGEDKRMVLTGPVYMDRYSAAPYYRFYTAIWDGVSETMEVTPLTSGNEGNQAKNIEISADYIPPCVIDSKLVCTVSLDPDSPNIPEICALVIDPFNSTISLVNYSVPSDSYGPVRGYHTVPDHLNKKVYFEFLYAGYPYGDGAQVYVLDLDLGTLTSTGWGRGADTDDALLNFIAAPTPLNFMGNGSAEIIVEDIETGDDISQFDNPTGGNWATIWNSISWTLDEEDDLIWFGDVNNNQLVGVHYLTPATQRTIPVTGGFGTHGQQKLEIFDGFALVYQLIGFTSQTLYILK